MAIDKIEILAKQDGKLDLPILEQRLLELKSVNWRILECIIYVKYNQDCSLNDAKAIVDNSHAWVEQKDDFIKHQEEMQQEFFEAMSEDEEKKYNRLYVLPKQKSLE